MGADVADAQLVVLVGHPKPYSRTHGVADRTGALLRGALATEHLAFAAPTVVDLAELAPYLLDRHDRGGPADRAVQTVRRATLLVAVSPTFRAAYSGLLKLFLDLLPRDGLAATVALPLMTAGLPAHRTAVDRTLRPVLQELRAQVPTTGICVLETELARVDEVFGAWWGEHGQPLAAAIRARAPEGANGRRVQDVERGGALAGRAGGEIPA
jgi:FMN reductase